MAGLIDANVEDALEKKHAMRDWEKDHDVMAAERALQPRYGNTLRNTPTTAPLATTSSHRAGGWRHSATLASSTSTTRSSARQMASDGCRAQLCMHGTHAKTPISNQSASHDRKYYHPLQSLDRKSYIPTVNTVAT